MKGKIRGGKKRKKKKRIPEKKGVATTLSKPTNNLHPPLATISSYFFERKELLWRIKKGEIARTIEKGKI